MALVGTLRHENYVSAIKVLNQVAVYGSVEQERHSHPLIK